MILTTIGGFVIAALGGTLIKTTNATVNHYGNKLVQKATQKAIKEGVTYVGRKISGDKN